MSKLLVPNRHLMLTRRRFIHGISAAGASAATVAAAMTLDATGANAYPPFLRGGPAPSGVITADVIVYGATPYGVMAAFEAARNGARVVVCGGWREQHVGGMMSGGLGGTDSSKLSVVSGVAYQFFSGLSTHYGRTPVWPPANSAALNFECSQAEVQFLKMLAQYSIRVAFSQGVSAVNMSGKAIAGFQTVDGQRFAGKVFIDASVELDLAATAGIPVVSGREANSTNNNLSGYGRTTSGWCASDGGASYPGPTLYNIDPYVTQGSPGSGFVGGVLAAPGNSSATAVNQGDSLEQAYNFRVGAQRATGFIPMPSSPVAGYADANYELVGRALAAFTAAGVSYGTPSATGFSAGSFLVFNLLPNNKLDVNVHNTGVFDYIGGNFVGGLSYLQQTYAQRAVTWQNTINYMRGAWYYFQHSTDARIPAALQAYFQSIGYPNGEFVTPYTGPYANGNTGGSDPVNWAYTMYVRSPRRLAAGIGGAVLNGADVSGTVGTPCRISNNIAANASYTEDFHACQLLAGGSAGAYSTLVEGTFDGGATGRAFPIPVEVLMPDASVCTNLLVSYGIAGSGQATSVTRIENTGMMMGQTCGAIAAITAASAAGTSVQTVAVAGYSTLASQMQSEDGAYPIVLTNTVN